MLFIILINSMFSADAELFWSFVCLESRLTKVLPVEGCLAQQLCETGDIPEAQVDSLTRQRMHTVSCIPAQTGKTQLSVQIQSTHSMPATSGQEVNKY